MSGINKSKDISIPGSLEDLFISINKKTGLRKEAINENIITNNIYISNSF